MKINNNEKKELFEKFGVEINDDGIIILTHKGDKLILSPKSDEELLLLSTDSKDSMYEIEYLTKKEVNEINKRKIKIDNLKNEISNIKNGSLLGVQDLVPKEEKESKLEKNEEEYPAVM